MAGKPWSEDEKNAVRERYGKEPARSIGRSIGRTPWGVRQMACKLKVAVGGASPGTETWNLHRNEWRKLSSVVTRHSMRNLLPEEHRAIERLKSQPVLLGYFAGLLDGEGTIVSGRAVHNHHLSLANTCPEMIEWLLVNIGGSCNTRKKRMEHHKQQQVWILTRTGYVIAILSLVLPFLTAKRTAAEKAIQLFNDHF